MKKLGRYSCNTRQTCIGVWGTSPGCGVTHLSIAIAKYAMHIQGHKTAYIEFGAQNEICNLLDVNDIILKDFTYQGIRFYCNVTREKLWNILSKGYETIILDLGLGRRCISKELQLCNYKFIVVDGAIWKRKFRNVSSDGDWQGKIGTYQVLVPFANQQTIRRVKQDYGSDVYSIPYQPNAFCLNPPMIHLLNELFRFEG